MHYPLTVLVVDDSADTAESLAELLTMSGHIAAIALDGGAALRRVAEEMPDVVLLDIAMPGVDGCEVAERIWALCRDSDKRPLLIAVTGYGSDGDRLRSTQAGFDLHLVKPVEPATLVGMMERFRRLLSPPIPVEELDLSE